MEEWSEDNLTIIAEFVVQIPKDSKCKSSAELNISCGSVYRIMKSLKPKPYRPYLSQGLLEDDFNSRVEFTEWYGIRHEVTTTFTMHSLGG